MSEGATTWFVEARLEWIRESVTIFGFINRSHIMRKFGISAPQAAQDLGRAQRRWPKLLQYNATTKRYERSPE